MFINQEGKYIERGEMAKPHKNLILAPKLKPIYSDYSESTGVSYFMAQRGEKPPVNIDMHNIMSMTFSLSNQQARGGPTVFPKAIPK
jgi:hypothetical protein